MIYLMIGTVITVTVLFTFFVIRKKPSHYSLSCIDEMDGYDFEKLVAVLLQKSGAEIIEITKKSGDYGADIIIKQGNERIAVQCKRQASNVGVKAVQEAKASESYYNANRSAVITNSYFTRQAISLADENNVILWDRETLESLISEFEKNGGKNSNDDPDDMEKLNSAAVYISAIILPVFPEEGILITRGKNTYRLNKEKTMVVELQAGKHEFIFYSGRKKKRINIEIKTHEKLYYAAGAVKGRLTVFQISR